MSARLALIAASALALSTASSFGAASQRRCALVPGEGVIPTDIRAVHLSCLKARRLADAVSKAAESPAHGCATVRGMRLYLVKPCVRKGYRCVTLRRIGYPRFGIKVGCRRDGRRVTWKLQ